MPEADTITTLAQPFYMLAGPYQQPEQAEVNVGIPLDSIFRPCDTPEPVLRQTLFTGHHLTPQHSTLQERADTTQPAWIFVALVMLVGLVCLYFRGRKLKLTELMKSTIDSHAGDRIMRNNSIPLAPIALLLCLSLGMALWFMALRGTGILGYLATSAALAAGYLLRNGILTGLAAVFDRKQTMVTYITGNYIYHLALTIITIPLLFALIYIPGVTDGMAIAIASLIALVFIMRFLRGCKLFLTQSKSFSFFLFYYLCTAEMAPIIVAIAWLTTQ